jgi:WD40 repeat protein
MAARRTGTQLKRMSDWLGSENLYGSDSTSSSRNSFGSVFSPDGNYLASAHDGSVQLRETATGRVVTGVKQTVWRHVVSAVSFSHDGRYVASADSEKSIRVWEAMTGDEDARMTHDKAVRAIAFSPDGRMLASGSKDRTARVWDLTTAGEISRRTHDGGSSGLLSAQMGG